MPGLQAGISSLGASMIHQLQSRESISCAPGTEAQRRRAPCPPVWCFPGPSKSGSTCAICSGNGLVHTRSNGCITRPAATIHMARCASRSGATSRLQWVRARIVILAPAPSSLLALPSATPAVSGTPSQAAAQLQVSPDECFLELIRAVCHLRRFVAQQLRLL